MPKPKRAWEKSCSNLLQCTTFSRLYRKQDFSQARLGFGIYPVYDTAFAWQSIQKRFRLWLEDDEKNGTTTGREKIEALVPGWEKHPASLVALCENILKLGLPKELQRSDWNGQLSEEQLGYAAMDVAVPLPLVPYMKELAKKIGVDKKIEWRCGITRKEAAKHAKVLRGELDESREMAWRLVYAENLEELAHVGNIA